MRFTDLPDDVVELIARTSTPTRLTLLQTCTQFRTALRIQGTTLELSPAVDNLSEHDISSILQSRLQHQHLQHFVCHSLTNIIMVALNNRESGPLRLQSIACHRSSVTEDCLSHILTDGLTLSLKHLTVKTSCLHPTSWLYQFPALESFSVGSGSPTLALTQHCPELKSLSVHAPPTNATWQYLPNLRSVHIDGGVLSLKPLVDLPLLEELSARYLNNPSETLREILDLLPNLRSIEINNAGDLYQNSMFDPRVVTQLGPARYPNIRRIVGDIHRHFRQRTTRSPEKTQMNIGHLWTIFENLESFTSFEPIDGGSWFGMVPPSTLREVIRIPQTASHHFVMMLQDCPNLEYVDLSEALTAASSVRQRTHKQDLISLATATRLLLQPPLRVLICNPSKDPVLQAVFVSTLSEQCPHLEKLETTLLPESLQATEKPFLNLKEFITEDFCDETAVAIAQWMPNLETLDVVSGNNTLSDIALQALSTLGSLQSLSERSLKAMKAADGNTRRWRKELYVNREYLQVTADGFRAFCEARCHSLRYLRCPSWLLGEKGKDDAWALQGLLRCQYLRRVIVACQTMPNSVLMTSLQTAFPWIEGKAFMNKSHSPWGDHYVLTTSITEKEDVRSKYMKSESE